MGLSISVESLGEEMVLGVPKKTPTGSECLGNASLEVRVSEGGCISQNSSHMGPDD